jgi:hypothetical protein
MADKRSRCKTFVNRVKVGNASDPSIGTSYDWEVQIQRTRQYLKQGRKPGLKPEQALLGLLALEHGVHHADEVQGLRLQPGSSQ